MTENEIILNEIIKKIDSADENAMVRAKRRWDSIGKPLGSMGMFEEVFVCVAGIKKTESFNLNKKAIAVMCSDNGVVEEGVSQSGSEVTAIVAKNMTIGKSSVCLLAKKSGTNIRVFDVGMKTDVEGVPNYKCAYGSENMCKGPAMTRENAVKAILNGIHIAEQMKDNDIVGVGEMGIGNTTTSAAVCSILTGCPAVETAGYGAGLSTDGYLKKLSAINRAIEINQPDINDVIDVLAKVGGYDIAALTGFIIGCGVYRIPVVLDGVITQTAALAAVMLNDKLSDYIFASHLGKEPACTILEERLSLKPIIYADMALGEGTGAALFMSLIDSVRVMYEKNLTFEDINVEQYEDFKNV